MAWNNHWYRNLRVILHFYNSCFEGKTMNNYQIKVAREEMGMTPDQLAAIMDVKRAEIYRIESANCPKTPPRRFVTLMRALMSGWRP